MLYFCQITHNYYINMRKSIRIFLFYLILLGMIDPKVIAENKYSNPADSVLTFDHIYNICITQPQQALKLLNKAEERKVLSQYELNQLRCITYNNGLAMYRIALMYAQKNMQSDSIQNHPDKMLTLAITMTGQYLSIGNHKESIRCAIKGIELAQKLGNKAKEAYLLLTIGKNKWEMGLKKEAGNYIDRSIKIQEQCVQDTKNWEKIDDLIYSYGIKITYAMKDGDYQAAIDLLPAYEKQMQQMKKCINIPQGVCDMRYASEYAAFAYIFTRNGQPEKGKKYYRKFQKTDFSSTHFGQTMGIKYLLAAKKYKEALKSISAEKRRCREIGDTINDEYLHNVLGYEAQACSELGNATIAANCYKQMYIIADSLQKREKQNTALELATIYETNEKNVQIQKQTADLKQRNILLFSLTGIVILMLVLLWHFVQHAHVIKKKNLTMAERINELLLYKDELQKTKRKLINLITPNDIINEIPNKTDQEDGTDTYQENNRKLFEALNQTIIDKELYLNPELTRDDLVQIIHVNKNRFAKIIQENTKMRLTEYLNEMRLNHSIQLLKEHPNYTLQAIAYDSGFSNMGTFHRLFKEKIGMTPSEYKSISKKMK